VRGSTGIVLPFKSSVTFLICIYKESCWSKVRKKHPCVYFLFSSTDSMWAVKLHWLDNILFYMITDHIIAFLLPDSCRATKTKCNSISADVVEDIIKNNQNDASFCFFSDILAVALDIVTLHNITIYVHFGKYNIYLHLLWNSSEKLTRPACLPVSKARTNKLYNCWPCTYISYRYSLHSSFC